MTSKDRLEALLLKSSSGKLSAAERDELWAILSDPEREADSEALLKSLWREQSVDGLQSGPIREEMLFKILEAGSENRSRNRFIFNLSVGLTSAAAMFFIVYAVFFSSPQQLPVGQELKTAAIEPGATKAILTLGDGTQVSLEKMGDSILAGGNVITKTNDGRLVYEQGHGQSSEGAATQYHTVTTPKGGVYQVTLPDGTTVHLNSGSSLKYPTIFRPESRDVEIVGEAFFEVARLVSNGPDGHRIPFVVRTGNQQIEVLGTQFNVHAYPGKKYIKTTLVEGSVKVNYRSSAWSEFQAVKLTPGFQVINNFESLKVEKADVSQVIAWKGGYFVFNNTNIRDIMDQLGLWYNIEVSYQGDLRQKHFGGIFKRSKSIYQILENIQETGSVHFKVEGKEVTVIAN